MARSITSIQNQILAAIAADPDLSALNSTSKVAIYNKLAFIIASSMAVEEQLNDQFKLDIEAIALTLPPGTPGWIQAITFLFQYSSTTTQIPALNTNTFTPYYPSGTNTAYQIITNCSVTNGLLNSVIVKTAKAGPTQLATTELLALQYYLNLVKPAGIIYKAISLAPDKIKCGITVKYRGIYSSTIANSLLLAYNNYLQSLPFDGIIYLDELLNAFRIQGVINVTLNNVVIRPDTISYPGGSVLVYNNDWLIDSYSTKAGFLIDETTSGQDFLSNLNLIAM